MRRGILSQRSLKATPQHSDGHLYSLALLALQWIYVDLVVAFVSTWRWWSPLMWIRSFFSSAVVPYNKKKTPSYLSGSTSCMSMTPRTGRNPNVSLETDYGNSSTWKYLSNMDDRFWLYSSGLGHVAPPKCQRQTVRRSMEKYHHIMEWNCLSICPRNAPNLSVPLKLVMENIHLQIWLKAFDSPLVVFPHGYLQRTITTVSHISGHDMQSHVTNDWPVKIKW